MSGHVLVNVIREGQILHDAEDALRQTKAGEKADVALDLVDMGGQTLNTASAMVRFFLNMMAGLAELERNLIAERTAAALAHKKAHLQAYSPHTVLAMIVAAAPWFSTVWSGRLRN